MKKTVATLTKLLRLAKGEALPESELRGEWVDNMIADGVLVAVINGSHKRLRATDGAMFRHYLESRFDIRNLESTIRLLSEDNVSRAEMVTVTGDSKYVAERSFEGFLVNSYEPIEATLNDQTITVFPPEGSFMFVADWRNFKLPEDVVIVGVENSENFRYVRLQKHLFERLGKVLFVSRYPQNKSKDLFNWLMSVDNRYVHFGDLDLAGLAIYQNEFYRHLGERASFFVPENYSELIAEGSRKRYEAQFPQYGKMYIRDPRVFDVVRAIHRNHRGYDQEGLISRPVR